MAGDVTVLNTESGYVVAIEDIEGEITFTFEDIEERARDLTCQVTVQRGFESFTERINILSQSAKDGFRRTAQDIWDMPKGAWAGIISAVFSAMRIAHIERDWSVNLKAVEMDENPTYIIHPTIPQDGHTIWFGPGESAKTYLLLAMCLSVAYGLDDYGYQGAPQPILFIDYESGSTILKRRLLRLAKGMGLTLPDSFFDEMFHYWPGAGRPLASMIPALKRKIESGVGFIVVDSAGLAAGGNPRDEQIALGYFNAVHSLKVPCVSIAHTTKEEDDRYPLGSIYWHTSARATWFARTDGEVMNDIKRVALVQKKGNEDARHRPVGFEIEFGAGETVIRKAVAGEDSFDIRTRIRRALLKHGKVGVKFLSDELGEKPNTLYKHLRSMRDVLHEGTKGSHDTVYFVLAPSSDLSDEGIR